MINRITLTAGCLFIMSACNNAVAIDIPEKQPKTKPVTRTECLTEKVKEDKIACFKKLAEQRKAKIAETQRQTEAIKTETEKIKKENEELLREFEKGVLDEE